MNIAVVSDLHVENWENYPFDWRDAIEADALVRLDANAYCPLDSRVLWVS